MTHSQHAAPTLGSSMATVDVRHRRHSSQCESSCAAGQHKESGYVHEEGLAHDHRVVHHLLQLLLALRQSTGVRGVHNVDGTMDLQRAGGGAGM